MRLKGAGRLHSRYSSPADRACRLIESMTPALPMGRESDRSAVTAQPDRDAEEQRGGCQPDPEPRARQELLRRDWVQRVDEEAASRPEGEGLGRPAHRPVGEEGREEAG